MEGRMRDKSDNKNKKIMGLMTAAFFLPVILLLFLYIVKGIYPFGEKGFLTGDLYHQYLPFFQEFLRLVRNGEGLDFSYRAGIGSNFMALYVYYLASPFHFPALLGSGEHLMEYVGYLMILKTGLCGLTAAYYFRKHFHTESGAVVLFSLFYAFSGYMAAYSYNIMWIDCIWLLPLILLGVESLVKEGKGGLYCVTLAFSIYTNYYISIMICMYLVLYFGALLVIHGRGAKGSDWLKRIGRFTLYSLLAGAMAGVLLVPEVCAILKTNFSDSEFPEKIKSYFSVLDMLARHCVCVSTEHGLDHWPNIYAGSMVLMLIPMYVMNKHISIREKFCKLALAGFFLLSFSTNVLDFIWHGMNYPDSLPARQSFLYIFLVLTMCYDAFHHVKEESGQQILYGYLTGTAFLLFCEKFITHEDFEMGVKLFTLILITIYSVLLYFYRTAETDAGNEELCGENKNGYEQHKRNVTICVGIVALCVALTECGINTYDTGIGTSSREKYVEKQGDYQALYQWTKEREEGFYRLEQFERKTKNDSMLGGFPSASIFSSTMNSRVMDLYTRLGMRHSKVFYCFDGATAFTSALLNVNYMYGEEDGYENSLYQEVEQSGSVRLYECNYKLPFGYVAPIGYDLPAGYENKPLELQNEMAEQLGVTDKIFEKVDSKRDGDDCSVTPKKGGIFYGVVTSAGTTKITGIGGAREQMEFKDLKKGCVLYLGYLEKDQTLTVTNGDDNDTTPRISVDFYRLNTEGLEEALQVLGANHLENVTMEGDRITGTLQLEEAGRLLLTLPNEAGWKLWVNGTVMETTDFGGCLIAVDLEPGTYDICMEYRAEGRTAGLLLSLLSVLVFVGILLGKSGKFSSKKRKQESPTEETKKEVFDKKVEKEKFNQQTSNNITEGESADEV